MQHLPPLKTQTRKYKASFERDLITSVTEKMQVLLKKERNILLTFFVSFLAEALPIIKKKLSSFNNKLTLNFDEVLWHFFRFLWENAK